MYIRLVIEPIARATIYFPSHILVACLVLSRSLKIKRFQIEVATISAMHVYVTCLNIDYLLV